MVRNTAANRWRGLPVSRRARIDPRSRTWAPPFRRRRQAVGRRQVTACGARVAWWSAVWSTAWRSHARTGAGDEVDHEHRRARLVSNAFPLLAGPDGSETARIG